MNEKLEAKLAALQAAGLTYTATFVPQSASRNSAEERPTLNWRVTLHRAGTPGGIISTDYSQGIGHLPKSPRAKFNPRFRSNAQDKYERECAESGRYADGKLTAPAMADVLYSLLLDGSAADESFEDWCATYGYDTDSRKAEKTYDQCRDIGRSLERMSSRADLAELRELFQDY